MDSIVFGFSLAFLSAFVLSKYSSNKLHKHDITMLWNYFMIFPADSLEYEIDSAAGTLREKERQNWWVSKREESLIVFGTTVADRRRLIFMFETDVVHWTGPGTRLGTRGDVSCSADSFPSPSPVHTYKQTHTGEHKYWPADLSGGIDQNRLQTHKQTNCLSKAKWHRQTTSINFECSLKWIFSLLYDGF